MKIKPDIDELLNGFIDGELSSRQQTEVQRLIANDTQVQQRLKQLKKTKLLVGSLPFVEAPSDTFELVTTSLERRTLLDEQPTSIDQYAGARQPENTHQTTANNQAFSLALAPLKAEFSAFCRGQTTFQPCSSGAETTCPAEDCCFAFPAR